MLTLLVAGYYLSLFRHPLVIAISQTPDALRDLSLEQLQRAITLMGRVRRKDTALEGAGILESSLNQTLAFESKPPWERYRAIIEHLSLEYRQPEDKKQNQSPLLLPLHLGTDFPLNLPQCSICHPEPGQKAAEVVADLRKRTISRGQVILLLHPEDTQQRLLNKEAADLANLLVAPQPEAITRLLLSNEPREELTRIISAQVNLARISPYQMGGGVNKPDLFFGRADSLSHIMNRDPANYLVVGGRQLGKSSLLKALERAWQTQRPDEPCCYLALSKGDPAPHIARSLGLDRNSDMEAITSHLSIHSDRHLFLIDEADEFIRRDEELGYPVLKQLRSLSESDTAWFILAGYWQLYRHTSLDYQSPLKNFGETLTISALEPESCRDLAVKPMGLMGIAWDDDALARLLDAVGGRANLISITCNEILKRLDLRHRRIDLVDVDRALDSEAVRTAISGWQEAAGDNDQERRLAKIVVYATIEQESFSLADLLDRLGELGVNASSEQVQRVVERLSLAYVIGREKEQYRYMVPLFTEMILAQEPGRLLAQELRRDGLG